MYFSFLSRGGHMKRIFIAAALTAGLSGTSMAAEFQPMGALGIGGAGVARIVNGYAPYWNPAGLAFNDQSVSVPLDVSVGLRVSKGLADNVDKLGKYTEKDPVTGKTAFDSFKDVGSTLPLDQQAKAVANAVGILTIFKDIKAQNGTISLNANAVLGLQISHFGTGVFGSMEGFAQALPDLDNILPGQTTSTTSSTLRNDLFNAVKGQPTTLTAATQSYFTTAQITDITNALNTNGVVNTAAQPNLQTQIINAIGSNLATAGGAGSNIPAVSSSAAAQTITQTLAPALSATSTANSIDNNKSGIQVKSLAFVEIPLSYGHPLDLGTSGKLGLGITGKVISGRVYQTRLQIFEKDATGSTTSTSSNDISKSFRESYEETTNLTFDLGAFYKYSDWFNFGLVAKNLTSPKFKSPLLKNQNGALVDAKGNTVTVGVRDADVTIKPQLRTGIALDPLSWLTLAADLDLTENESILTGLGYKSRNLGGGVEFHPGRWFKLRGGMYKNLANNDVGPVATAGLTFGLPWLNLEVDGAYGLETSQFKDKNYPREARVQAQLNIQY